MSRLTEYYDYAYSALDSLDGYYPPAIYGDFRPGTEPFQYPIRGIPSLHDASHFYNSRQSQVQARQLDDQRKHLYCSFATHMIWAHTAVAEHPEGPGNISSLHEPLYHVTNAMECMGHLRDLDMDQNNANDPEDWVRFELDSLNTCLKFCVQLLHLILPDRSEFWNECRQSLDKVDWHRQFCFDTRKILQENMERSRHTMRDVLETANSKPKPK
jgi:hypothetical protein